MKQTRIKRRLINIFSWLCFILCTIDGIVMCFFYFSGRNEDTIMLPLGFVALILLFSDEMFRLVIKRTKQGEDQKKNE